MAAEQVAEYVENSLQNKIMTAKTLVIKVWLQELKSFDLHSTNSIDVGSYNVIVLNLSNFTLIYQYFFLKVYP